METEIYGNQKKISNLRRNKLKIKDTVQTTKITPEQQKTQFENLYKEEEDVEQIQNEYKEDNNIELNRMKR